jgi:hypothetical protein
MCDNNDRLCSTPSLTILQLWSLRWFLVRLLRVCASLHRALSSINANEGNVMFWSFGDVNILAVSAEKPISVNASSSGVNGGSPGG